MVKIGSGVYFGAGEEHSSEDASDSGECDHIEESAIWALGLPDLRLRVDWRWSRFLAARKKEEREENIDF